ncbi:uncharacterized protein LOC144103927 [Amblyomma americanum]
MTDKNDSNVFQENRLGSCAFGTHLLRNQTRVTCDRATPCTNYTFTLRTQVNGPPTRRSRGATIASISIPAKAPEPPRNITSARRGTSVRVQWKQSLSPVLIYLVKVCNWCAWGDSDCCWTKNTTNPFLVFNQAGDEDYSVQVTAGTQCGSEILWSRPTTQEFVSVLTDVTNLHLVEATTDSFTVTWQRPKSRFDYYIVKVSEYESNSGSTSGGYHHVGWCRNGTIIHRDQTRLTCGQIETCGNVSVTVHTHRNVPNERTSAGATLRGIYFAGKAEPRDVVDLKLAAIGTDYFTLNWTRPRGCFDSYLIDFIDENHRSGARRQYRFGTCHNSIIGPEQTSITCKKLKACTKVSVRVRTAQDRPSTLTSPGVMQKGILIPGGAPEGFSISVRRINLRWARVTIGVSNIEPCTLGSCSYIVEGLRHGALPCGRDFLKPFFIQVPVTAFKRYTIHVTLANPHNGLTSTRTASIG